MTGDANHAKLEAAQAELAEARSTLARIRAMAEVWLVDEDGTPYAEGVCDAARSVLEAIDGPRTGGASS